MRKFRVRNGLVLAVALTGALVFGIVPVLGAETQDFTLRLAEFAFDPLQGEPELPQGWGRSVSSRPDLHLVQFDGPIPEDALEKLRARGLEPVQYVHPSTYIVWGRAGQRDDMSREKSVRWTGDFAPAYRVQPQWRSVEGDALQFNVLIYRGADADATVDALVALGGKLGNRLVVNSKLELAGFTLPGDRMPVLAAVPGVYSIQLQPADGGSRGEATAQINAGNVDMGNVAIPGYQAWLAGLGLDGTGVLVANVDEGIDETHPDLAARMLPCTGATCSTTLSLHGTHTAAIIAGDGTSGTLDTNGFLRGLGVAPGANLIEQRYFPTMLAPGGMLTLMTDSHDNGALISNNSWGSSAAALGYDVSALLLDAGVRDADPLAPGNQSLIYIQAIDNGNGGVSSQGAPDDAKNIFTIGSTMGIGADGNPDPGINNLSSNTAHGPALDGRTIPHMVAPGCWVDSAYPDDGQGNIYNARCGTSQATPQVAGAAALFVEYYRGLPGYTADPSPALVKAAFMPVAHDLETFNDADGVVMGHRPDSKQGWGRMNLPAVIDSPAGSVEYWDQIEVFNYTGNEWLRTVTPVDPAQPMRIMLTWTDAPGHGLGGSTPAWNNDLDLVVHVGADTYNGNFFGIDGFSATGGVADAMNNAEGVFLPPLLGSDVTIRVVAANINSDGVPEQGDETDQDFALVCYNCTLVPGFALQPIPVRLDLCAPNQTEFAIEVEQHSGYASPVTLSALDVPAGATAGFDVNPVAPGGAATLSFDPGTAVDGDYTIDVHGDSVDLNRTHPIFLQLRTAVPATAGLTLPLGGAIDVFPQPVLEWAPVSWANEYVVELSTDPTFADIFYTGLSTGTTHTVREVLEQGVVYHWRVRASNVCGFGAFSASSSFTTLDVVPVLLVDDDYDLPNEQNEYTTALDALGVSYDVWDVFAVHFQEEPDYSTLAHYDRVVWFSGREEVYAGPSSFTEGELDTWLDHAGCLFVSSPDYVLNSDFSTFIQQRLGVASAVEDTGMNNVTGAGTVFTGLGPWTLGNVPGDDWSDSLTPDATAEVAFTGDLGTAAVNKDGGFYRSAFLGYGLERLSAGETQSVLGAFFGWCDGLPAVDGDADGIANSADCAPGDANAWTTPSGVTDLRLSKDVIAFIWSEPLSGSGSIYDVLRSDDNNDFWNATCVATGVPGPPDWDDADPLPGELFFYVVRSRGECGTSMGVDLGGSPRHGRACE